MRCIAVGGAPYCRVEDQIFLSSHDWFSLEQWIKIFEEIIFLKPEMDPAKKPERWVEVPIDIQIVRLCGFKSPILQRKNEIRKAVKIFRPNDIFYARMPSYEVNWCYKAAKEKGVRLLLELHGDWESAVKEEDAKGIIRSITRPFRARMAHRAMSSMAEDAECILAVGPTLLKKYARDKNPSLVSTNHLLPERIFKARESYALHTPARLLFVGVLNQRKGLETLLKTLRMMHETDIKFEMILVGTGPLKERLGNYAHEHGFGANVQFLGHINQGDDLYDEYKKADIFILPSVAAEGVPRVTHEAMAFGCPVIATNIGSIDWQLKGDSGLVIEPNNEKALFEAISRVIKDADYRKIIGRNGHKTSLEYTIEKQTQLISNFVSVFQETGKNM